MPPVPSAESILAGDRRALARAITLVESRRSDHRRSAVELLEGVLPATGGARRIGISGTPGVGKSTFIEALGLALVERGERVAVLAVDPSSKRTGGSILGDRTRMIELSKRREVYIRSSPSGGSLGGVAEHSRETLLLCEAAGFTVVLVETVGVGQSETSVADMTDLFLLLVAPAGGDDLQGIKRGVMEIADFIAINKADGDLLPTAERTANDYQAALSLVRPKWLDHPTEVRLCSALQRSGIDDLWTAIDERWTDLRARGILDDLRADQSVRALWHHVTSTVVDELVGDRDGDEVAAVEAAVRTGQRSPAGAAHDLVRAALARLATAARG